MSDQDYVPRPPSYPPSSPPAPTLPSEKDEYFFTRRILFKRNYNPAVPPNLIDNFKAEGITDRTIGLVTPHKLTKIGVKDQKTFFDQLRLYSAWLRSAGYCALEALLHEELEKHGQLHLCPKIWEARDILLNQQQTQESVLAAINLSAVGIIYVEDRFKDPVRLPRIALAALRLAYTEDTTKHGFNEENFREDYPDKYFVTYSVLMELIRMEENQSLFYPDLEGSALNHAEPLREFVRKAVAVCPVVYLQFWHLFHEDAEFTLELININTDVIFGIDNALLITLFRRLPDKVIDDPDLLIRIFGVDSHWTWTGTGSARIRIPWEEDQQLALDILQKCPMLWKNIQLGLSYRWSNTNLARLAARAIMQSDAEGRAVLLHCMALKEPKLLKQEKVQEAISGSPRRPRAGGGRRLDYPVDRIVVDQENFVGAFVDVSK